MSGTQKYLTYWSCWYSWYPIYSMKTCNKCGVEKPLSEYYKKNRKRKDGTPYVRYECVCKQCMLAHAKDRYDNEPALREEQKEYSRQWHKDNSDHYNARRKKRYDTDPVYKLVTVMRARATTAAKRIAADKMGSSLDWLGMEFEDYKRYLEAMFTPEMNWDNHGSYWEIDHITPLCSAQTLEEVVALCHYSNTQPLPSDDNRRKAGKLGS